MFSELLALIADQLHRSRALRTPLAAVKGSVTTLLDAAVQLDPAETAQFHQNIRDQSDLMRLLIGDLPVALEPTELAARARATTATTLPALRATADAAAVWLSWVQEASDRVEPPRPIT